MLATRASARRRIVVRAVASAVMLYASAPMLRAETALERTPPDDGALAAAMSVPLADEPLVPRGVPAAARGWVQSLLLSGGTLPVQAWHLSVINGGSPRGEAAAYRISGPTVLDADDGPGRQARLHDALWLLRTGDSPELPATTTLVFGVRGARPVCGDFNGDGRAEIGIFVGGRWLLDTNGNGAWDADDLCLRLGSHADLCVTGDWDGDGKTDVGVFGPAWAGDARAMECDPGLPDADNRTRTRRKNAPAAAHRLVAWRALQTSAAAAWRTDPVDHVLQYGSSGDLPVAGDFNGDGVATIGVFRGGQWCLDLDGDGRFTAADAAFEFGQEGDLPVVGDFNGDGVDDVGTFRLGQWRLDVNGNRRFDEHDLLIAFGQEGDLPVAGDFTGAGRAQIGVYRPAR